MKEALTLIFYSGATLGIFPVLTLSTGMDTSRPVWVWFYLAFWLVWTAYLVRRTFFK